MVLGLIAGILSILTTWVILLAISCGIGLTVRRAFGVKVIDSDGLLGSFWLGMSLTVLFLQVWHFLFPIRWHALAVMLAVGIAGLFWSATDLRVWLDRTNWRKRGVLIVSLTLVGMWVANHAMGLWMTATGTSSEYDSGAEYDSGMYHRPAVDWAKSFPIVPGLGNLHGRLAFNNSSLLYAAMVDVGPWSGRSNHIVNGLFLFILLIQIVLRIYQLPRASEVKRAHCIFDIALLAPTIGSIQSSFFISSLTPEVPTALVLFVAVSRLFAQLVNSEEHRDENEKAYNFVVLTTMLTVAVCFKLSAAPFSVVAWLLAVIWWLRRNQRGKILITKTLAWMVTISLALGLSWLGRGVILSGYPAYPSLFGAFPVEWRVPTEQAEAEQAWIRHFARYYYNRGFTNSLYADQVTLKWTWLLRWMKGLIKWSPWQIALPTLLTILLASSRPFLRHRRESDTEFTSAGWLLLIPILSGITFWFIVAPRPEFGFFLFWILAALCAGQIVNTCIGSATHRFTAALLVAGLLVGTLPIGFHLSVVAAKYLKQGINPLRAFLVKPGPDLWFHPIPTAKLEVFTAESGLRLYVPKDDNRCFHAPLPCTPHPAANLRLRRTGSLGSGFVTEGQWRALRYPNPQSPFLSFWRDYRSRIASPESAGVRQHDEIPGPK